VRDARGARSRRLTPAPAAARRRRALRAGRPRALEQLAEGAGLVAERAIDVPTPYAHADVETATRAHLASGPARRAIEHAGLDATRDAIFRACEGARTEDGSVRFENVFKVVIARA
jgi:hypothetical protein